MPCKPENEEKRISRASEGSRSSELIKEHKAAGGSREQDEGTGKKKRTKRKTVLTALPQKRGESSRDLHRKQTVPRRGDEDETEAYGTSGEPRIIEGP